MLRVRLARRCRLALMPSALAIASTPAGLTAQGSAARCAPHDHSIDSVVDAGWRAMRESQLAAADAHFQAALARCAHFSGALVGEGYVALRRADDRAAESYFEAALTEQPSNYDALAGLGMLAYRRGDLTGSRRRFRAALRVVPRDSVSLWYLARIPGGLDSLQLSPPARPPRTIVAARTGDRVLEVPNGSGGFTPLWVKAVNLGAALPGKHPSEFPPDDSTYERWIELVARMNANAIRVYTIHPPHFYRALAQWNRAHPDRPLWLIQGVWAELPPGRKEERYGDPAWNASFAAEMHRVVDLVHGEAAIPPRPGHASGIYTADVSRWTLAYIIGREWEPYSVAEYVRLHQSEHSFHGRYLMVDGGNAVDARLAKLADGMIGYEMDRYNEQRPIAYTNWPTLDPLVHPTESTLAQEDSIRRVRHEIVPEAPKEYDNDAVALDAALVRPTAAFPAGTFASFHAYPYYPDFISLDRGYAAARSPDGPSNYYGYLRALVEHFGRMPVVISEYGVPSSRGVAHLQPQGWHHGGHSETEQAAINARLTRDIYASGAAGAGLFSLIDEWFKKNWTVIDFEHPAERKRLWFNQLDAEESYGVVAMRAGRRDSAIVIDGRGDDWNGRPIWYEGTTAHSSLPAALRLQRFRVASDEAYLYLRLDVGAIDWESAHYLIGIDTYSSALGDVVLPYTHTRSPVGLEFVVDLHGPAGSHLLVDRPYDLYRDEPIIGSRPLAVEQIYNRPFRSQANAAGQYDSTIVITNRRRIGRDGTVYERSGIDRGQLLFARQSENSLADWYADSLTGIIEVRIPWGMLQVLDPSSRLVLHGSRSGEVAGVKTDGFRFVVESYDPHHPQGFGDRLPNGIAGRFGAVPTWSWREWEEPRWYPELKPQFETMREVFAEIPNAPATLKSSAADSTRKR